MALAAETTVHYLNTNSLLDIFFCCCRFSFTRSLTRVHIDWPIQLVAETERRCQRNIAWPIGISRILQCRGFTWWGTGPGDLEDGCSPVGSRGKAPVWGPRSWSLDSIFCKHTIQKIWRHNAGFEQPLLLYSLKPKIFYRKTLKIAGQGTSVAWPSGVRASVQVRVIRDW